MVYDANADRDPDFWFYSLSPQQDQFTVAMEVLITEPQNRERLGPDIMLSSLRQPLTHTFQDTPLISLIWTSLQNNVVIVSNTVDPMVPHDENSLKFDRSSELHSVYSNADDPPL